MPESTDEELLHGAPQLAIQEVWAVADAITVSLVTQNVTNQEVCIFQIYECNSPLSHTVLLNNYLIFKPLFTMSYFITWAAQNQQGPRGR